MSDLGLAVNLPAFQEPLLRSIKLDKETPLDRRFVALTWHVPLFMSWQRQRVEEISGSTGELDAGTTKIHNLLEELLGVP